MGKIEVYHLKKQSQLKVNLLACSRAFNRRWSLLSFHVTTVDVQILHYSEHVQDFHVGVLVKLDDSFFMSLIRKLQKKK